MSGTVEVDVCAYCAKAKPVSRRYYHYDIPCDCCNEPGELYHFEYVAFCKDCKDKVQPPQSTEVYIKPID